MDGLNKKTKREKLVLSCEHYKNILKKWDNAILKTEGRKPNKTDLKHAPENIQKSYKKYYKLVSYLKSSPSEPQRQSSGNSKGLTPRKIFDRTHPRSSDNSRDKPSTSRSREGRLFSHVSSGETRDKKKSGVDYNRFSEKISNVVKLLSNEPSNKAHTTVKVVEENSGQEVIRRTLIPNKFAKVVDRTDTVVDKPDKIAVNGLSDSSGNSSLLTDPEFEEEKLDLNEPGPSSQFSSRLNSVSAVWQNLSPNPKSQNRKSGKLKNVDSGWLTRCGMELNEDEEQTIAAVVDEVKEPIGVQNKDDSLFSQGFQKLLLSANSENDASNNGSIDVYGGGSYIPPLAIHPLQMEQLPVHCESQSGDSGIGLSASVLAVNFPDHQNVFQSNASNIMVEVEENSMFCNDNACPPPESYLETIDTSAIADILTTNPFSSSCSNTSPPELASRKRPVYAAFSPSPEKPKPRKKFFKSDRSHIGAPKYTVNSYKPLTPVKKKAVQPLPTVAPKAVSAFDQIPIASISTTLDDYQTASIIKKPLPINDNDTVDTDASDSSSPSFKKRVSRKSKLAGKSKAAPIKSKTVKKLRVSKPNALKRGATDKSRTNNDDVSAGPSTSYNQNTTSEYFDEITAVAGPTGRRGTRRARLTNKEYLQKKIDNGKLDDNFVRIDITKKVFVRGRKRISGAKVKRNDWKMRKASTSKEDKLKGLTCRKCGESGHFAKFCMKDSLPKEEPEQVDDSPFPTLEEVARMAKGPMFKTNTNRVIVYSSKCIPVENNDNEHPSIPSSQENTDQDVVDETNLNEMEDQECRIADSIMSETEQTTPTVTTMQIKPIPPYFGYETESTLPSLEVEDAILNRTLKKFGYNDFRGGQREAISRVLKGLSTLVILSTGSGKSLCYQLPAYLYAMKNPGALAICVSPLVSLMEDQVQGIPPFLKAACLHSNMLASQKTKVLDKIRLKQLHILLVSPEAVCGGLFGLLRGVGELPRISFACIDEVHCLSQWSHNFRPSYLQISKILREKLNVSTILGLTATATESTAISVCEHLQVDPATTIRGEIVPCNLNLSVSRDTHREEGLLTLLRGDRFKDCESIIIYCTRREECQRIACLIRTNLQDIPGFNGVTKTNLRQRVSNNCETYHAGMTAGRRRLVQQQFMSGKIRIVVATVAFGMGIDKSDIRAVIHYNMPKTFESYVQEIGRAGRDGQPAHCHLFLDNVKGRDLSELRRHVYSNSVDRPTLRKLLRRVFQPCKCKRLAELSGFKGSQTDTQKSDKRCPGHETSFSVADTVNELDLAQENIVTLLCYLELDKTKNWIEILPHTYETCKIHSYGGAKLLKSAALKCPALAAAIALKKEERKFKETDAYLEFNVVEVSATLGWSSGIVKRELKNLEWSATDFDNNGNSKRFRKSGILVEFCNLAFHLNAPGDLTDEEADIVLNFLHKHNVDHEQSQLYQLSRVYQALLSISCANVDSVTDTFDEEKSSMLKKFIYDYFTQTTLGVPASWKNDISQDEEKRDDIRRDVQDLLSTHRDTHFTGRSIAKIFQGIPSPCFPSEIWGRNRAFWRKNLEVDFNFLCQIAGQEILRHQ